MAARRAGRDTFWVKRFENMEFLKNIEAVILAGGDYPTAQTPLAILRSAPYVVCCDGATNEYIARGNRPQSRTAYQNPRVRGR